MGPWLPSANRAVARFRLWQAVLWAVKIAALAVFVYLAIQVVTTGGL